MEEFHYYINQPPRCCATCRHSRYDSDHDERWCGHDTPPNGLGEQLVVDYMGWCGQWEGELAPPDRGWYERKIPHNEGEVGAGLPAPPDAGGILMGDKAIIIDWSKPIRFDKHPARLLGEINDDEHPYVVAIDFGGYEEITKANKYGCTYEFKGSIVNAPVKHVCWINCYASRHQDRVHPTREVADACAGVSRIACIKVEFEEGEGL